MISSNTYIRNINLNEIIQIRLKVITRKI